MCWPTDKHTIVRGGRVTSQVNKALNSEDWVHCKPGVLWSDMWEEIRVCAFAIVQSVDNLYIVVVSYCRLACYPSMHEG